MTKDNLNRQVRFYSPHDGFSGAIVPLPPAAREIAKSLDGKVLTLEEGIKLIKKAVKGRVKVIEQSHYVLYSYQSGCFEHHFRLIKYREGGK